MIELSFAALLALVLCGSLADLNKSEWASWVQAVGSIGAIVGAVFVTRMQIAASQRLEEERMHRGRAGLAFVLVDVFANIAEVRNYLMDPRLQRRYFAAIHRAEVFQRSLDRLDSTLLSMANEPIVAHHFEKLRMLFKKLIEQIASIQACGEETDSQRAALEALNLTIESLEKERYSAELLISGLFERDHARESEG
ncbi:hypothetical protein [Rhodoferax sp. OV413]|uniref:hypothetical protein n=1 Tax=Rhodoferax sp. OV413 TaxID=1855285 RepID=UPI000B84DDCD|nr:hypothetical protein [Rhodoferax sp. OV413]